MPMPTFPPVESRSFDAFGVGVIGKVGVIEEADVLGEVAVKLAAIGLGGRLDAAFTGHAIAVVVGIYFSESMLDGETVAKWRDTF